MPNLISQPSVIAASQLGNLLSLDGSYLDYRVQEHFVWDNGQVQMPVAYFTGTPASAIAGAYNPGLKIPNRPAGSVTIPASLPYGVRAVGLTATRIGNPPALPAPSPQANETLLSFEIFPNSPYYTLDGKAIYSVQALYLYSQDTPAGTADGYAVAKTPLDSASGVTSVNTFIPGTA